VLGVDGEEGYVVLAGGRDDELAGGYEALLLARPMVFPRRRRRRWLESATPTMAENYEVDLGEGGDVDGAGGAVDDFDPGDAFGFEAGGEGCCEGFGGEGDCFGTPALELGEGYVDVGAGGERDYLVAVGEVLADGEGTVADGAGRTQDG